MWLRIACVLIVGYLSLSRAFAYLGIPPWNVFIGEAVLVLLFLWGPRSRAGRWPWVATKLPELKRFSTWYALFVGFGIAQVFHGVWEGNPPLIALRDLAFNYYPMYFFLGLWGGTRRPDLLPRLIRGFAWFNGVYGALYLLFLDRVEWFVPGVNREIVPVPIFAQPIYSFVALLGLMAYEKKLWRSWYLLLLNAFVMLGMQFRAEWLAFTVGVVTWCVLTRQGKRLLQTGAILASLLTLMYLSSFSLTSPQSRGEEKFSVRQLTGRALAPFHTELSNMSLASGAEGAIPEEATIAFRTVWWLAIWDSVHENPRTWIWGHGYGFPLTDLVPYLRGEFTRTPHNEFFYALGYTGWVGVILFLVLQAEILRLLWKAKRTTGEPFGAVYWMAAMTYGMFFALCETPYGAVPFYLITGWVAAPAILGNRSAQEKNNPGRVPYQPGASSSCPAVVSP